MAMYFKFKSLKDYDFVLIDGNFISIRELKAKIVEKTSPLRVGSLKAKILTKKIVRRGDVLIILNCETKEDYLDDLSMVPKHSSILVHRRPRLPIVLSREQEPALEVPTFKSLQTNSSHSFALDDIDEFGSDVYVDPHVAPAPISSPSEKTKDQKLSAFLETSGNEWQKQLQGSPHAYYARNEQRSEHGRKLQNAVPHQGYVYHRCSVPGHFIQHCPTNSNPEFDTKKIRPPTSIPKTMLIRDVEGTYFLPTGQVALLKPNESVFEREMKSLPLVGRNNVDIPPELFYPLCKGVFKDAMLVRKCCFMTYCDKCIRDHITSKGKCVCGARVLADDLLPNRTLTDAIGKLMESHSASSNSSGNVSTITSIGSAGPQASAIVAPKHKSPDNKNPVVGGVKQSQNPQVSILSKRSWQDMETGDSSESELMESTQEIVGSKTPLKPDRRRKGFFNSQATSDLTDDRRGPVSYPWGKASPGSKLQQQKTNIKRRTTLMKIVQVEECCKLGF